MGVAQAASRLAHAAHLTIFQLNRRTLTFVEVKDGNLYKSENQASGLVFRKPMGDFTRGLSSSSYTIYERDRDNCEEEHSLNRRGNQEQSSSFLELLG